MSEPHKPLGLLVDHRLILETSRLKQDQSEESLNRAKTVIKRSQFRLTRSAKRIVATSAKATLEEDSSTAPARE